MSNISPGHHEIPSKRLIQGISHTNGATGMTNHQGCQNTSQGVFVSRIYTK